jgi:hypothetical protein
VFTCAIGVRIDTTPVEHHHSRMTTSRDDSGHDKDLDALLSLGEVSEAEILAMVPSLVRASDGDVPAAARPLLARLAKAAGVTDRDDEATTAQKIAAFVDANTPRDEVKRGLFTLAAGKALDLVKAGAQAAFAKFSDDRATTDCPVPGNAPNDASGGKKGMSALDLRSGKSSKGD